MVDSISVTRPALSEEQFRQRYDTPGDTKSFLSHLQNWKDRNLQCSSKRFVHLVF